MAENMPGMDYEAAEAEIRALDRIPLPPGAKGLPLEPEGEAWTPARAGAAGLNALQDLPTPFAVLRQTALRRNAEVMGRYCADQGVLLAPHGKTTMAPALWKLQFECGAWALTVAVPHQAVTAYRFGVRRILLANEAADLPSLEPLVRLAARPGVELFCFVDSAAGVQAYRAAARRTGAAPAGLRFLIDVGVPNGRTGCRSRAEAEAVAREIEAWPDGVTAGVGAYEGPVGWDRSAETRAALASYLESAADVFGTFQRRGVFTAEGPPVLTIGGSEIFDAVLQGLQPMLAEAGPCRLVLRSGCYLVHDHGHYAQAGPGAQPGWAYEPFRGALEVGATVVSRPQPDLALLNAGRRDLGSDKGAPSVIAPLPPGGAPMPIYALNDQHAFVRPPDASSLPVGALARVGISHPCTTLDKWRVLLMTDDDYNVVDAAATIF